MKKMIVVGILGLATVLFGIQSRAATATGSFDVVINLTSKCEINTHPNITGAVISDLSLLYTSFQTASATGMTSFTVRCTNTLPITSIAVDSASVTDAATNLAYTLAVSSSSTHSVGPTASIVPASGTGSAVTYYVHGNIAGAQAGTCNTPSCTNAGGAGRTRTLTITY